MVCSIREIFLLHLVDVCVLVFGALIHYTVVLRNFTLLALSSDFQVVYLQLSCFFMLFHWPCAENVCIPSWNKLIKHPSIHPSIFTIYTVSLQTRTFTTFLNPPSSVADCHECCSLAVTKQQTPAISQLTPAV